VRPLQVKPKCAVTRLAFAPDGRLVVGQAQHGVRVIDPAGGAELSLVPVMDSSYRREHLTGAARQQLYLGVWDARFAEAAAGWARFRFQPGWRYEGGRCLPPAEAAELPFEASRWYAASMNHYGQLAGEPPPSPRNMWQSFAVLALSADHRFAVGGPFGSEALRVYDLARQTVAGKLDDRLFRGSGCRARFTSDGRRILVGNPDGVSIFDVPPEPEPRESQPPPVPPPTPAPRRGLLRRVADVLTLAAPPAFTLREAVWPKPPPRWVPPVLTPSAAAAASKPQPDTEPVPFALLPCGKRLLVRGIKSRVELRDAASGEVLTVWKWRLSRLLSLAVSADGLTAAAGGTGGQVMLWDLE
jgi:hypothetical protein